MSGASFAASLDAEWRERGDHIIIIYVYIIYEVLFVIFKIVCVFFFITSVIAIGTSYS